MKLTEVYEKIVETVETGKVPTKVVLSDELYIELVEKLRAAALEGNYEVLKAYSNLDSPSTILGGLVMRGNDFQIVFIPASAIEMEIF